MKKNYGFNFDNSFLSLPNCLYTLVKPIPVASPEIITFNEDLANKIGLNFSQLTPKAKAELFSGNTLLSNAAYFAQAYAGHQYGQFTILGDGRAIMLGEHMTQDGTKLDIQFKGSGRTPYSRHGDGRAALGPMLREFIISEAMYYLGIPTTRSLAVVNTGECIIREKPLSGAILTRIASSHLRIGTFEFSAYQNNLSISQSLLDYAIARHYPNLINSDKKAIHFLKAVMGRQADLIVQWMRVGFIHGVMNTDNMTISGETIDYGPCAFIDEYKPHTVFSSIDHTGRYAYDRQATIAQWNLTKLAESLLPLIHPNLNKAVVIAEDIINLFPILYQDKWLTMMRNKLGLFGKEKKDIQLIKDLLKWMERNNADFTNTFYELSQFNQPHFTLNQSESLKQWYKAWQARLKQSIQSEDDIANLMKKSNPVIIPRNHKIEQVIDFANRGELSQLYQLLDVLKSPYKYTKTHAMYQFPPSPEERVYQTFCGT